MNTYKSDTKTSNKLRDIKKPKMVKTHIGDSVSSWAKALLKARK